MVEYTIINLLEVGHQENLWEELESNAILVARQNPYVLAAMFHAIWSPKNDQSLQARLFQWQYVLSGEVDRRWNPIRYTIKYLCIARSELNKEDEFRNPSFVEFVVKIGGDEKLELLFTLLSLNSTEEGRINKAKHAGGTLNAMIKTFNIPKRINDNMTFKAWQNKPFAADHPNVALNGYGVNLAALMVRPRNPGHDAKAQI